MNAGLDGATMLDAAAGGSADLDRRVEAFEAAWAAGGRPDPAAFLPPPADPNYLSVLAELIRVDLELGHARGEATRLDRYRPAFPALFADPARLREVAFEEFRLRTAAGERPHPREYAARYRIDTAGWPPPPEAETGTFSPAAGLESADGRPRFPEPGETVLDFRLVAELGRGAFGRVYLAEQLGLAGRRVAVKLSTRFGRAEPETLARLQHTHIVPVYATDRAGPFQVLVMPYLGATTLADVLAELRGRGAWPASGKDVADTLAARRSETVPASLPGPAPAPCPAAAATPGVALEALARFTFPELVLWVGNRVADALAHAHDRGILHRDVKPANVLLTDDGQPMLLDFNLAATASGPAGVGGTPGYMAPEQLRALRGEQPAAVDARADVFGLGVVLFELLTGRHPFPAPGKPGGDSVAELLRGRSGPPPHLRPLNPAVTPATEAIVRRCLEPDPARRYPSARALADDLDRQLHHRPLAHVREPSARERFRKWRRRHPRIASSGTVAAVAAVLLLVAGGAGLAAWERADRLERERVSVRGHRDFRAETPAVVDQITYHGHDPRKKEAGAAELGALLDRYAWVAAHLPEADRREFHAERAELLLLRSRAVAYAETALALNDEAAAEYRRAGFDPVPKTVWLDRAAFLARLGRSDEAADARKAADAAPATARDDYLVGLWHLNAGEYRAAVERFESAARLDPSHYWTWLHLGDAYARRGANLRAVGCYNACVARRPDLAMGYFNRGLARLRLKEYAAAEQDFASVLRVQPVKPEAFESRAAARLALGRPGDAIADFTRAMDLGRAGPRLLLLRADAREKDGDPAGAAADRRAAAEQPPADAADWVARGLARARAGKPAEALADFDEALRLNPRSFEALQNKAHVLDGMLRREADAVAVLGTAIELYPDALLARAGRAVLLARRGDRAAAHADAEHCLKQGPSADIVYQLAGVYALTSQKHPEDARTAFRLLADALRHGAGFDWLPDDRDLDPLRSLPEFRLVVEAAAAVRPKK